MNQVSIRLPPEIYGEYAKRACRAGRRVTPIIQQVVIDAAKAPPPENSVTVVMTEEEMPHLQGVAKNFGIPAAEVLRKAFDLAFDELVDQSIAEYEKRLKRTEKMAAGQDLRPGEGPPTDEERKSASRRRPGK